MRIFFSVEAQAESCFIVLDILKQIESKIGYIEVTDYTDNLNNIGIIINCFDEYYLSRGFGKDRKYISYKKRYADIRLNIPFREFMEADRDKRFDMVKSNIYESVRIIDDRLNRKKGCSFNGERIIDYIEEKL